ncbi:MAG: hypothetical protein PHO55_07845 [Thiomonas arsenitoxydans]|nr:hypothetical protein [Thiomonas arsenitoxydans]
MGLLSVIVPEATTNLCTNPSLETNATGWAGSGAGPAVVARVATQQRRGVYSLEVTPTVATFDGAYINANVTAAQPIAATMDVLGVAGIPYRMTLISGAQTNQTPFIGTGAWQRVECLLASAGAGTVRVTVQKNNHASVAPYYLDGCQVEQLTYSTTYIDGDMADGYWTGARHASTSIRSAESARGGRIYDLDDLCNIRIGSLSGVGMPPQRHNALRQALLPGAQLQSIKQDERLLTLMARTWGNGAAGFYAARDALIDVLRPNRVGMEPLTRKTLQPVVLQYNNPQRRIRAYYDAGLEGDFRGDLYDTEDIALRLIAYEPFWEVDGQEGGELAFTRVVNNTSGALKREAGAWDDMAGGMTLRPRYVYAVEVDPNNGRRVWLGGTFTQMGGVACNGIALYDPVADTYTDIGGVHNANEIVYDLAVLPDGRLLVVGDFTHVDGGGAVAANNCAIYDLDTDTWSAIGGGTNGVIYGCAVDPLTGDYYFGGNFAAPFVDLCYWDVSAAAFVTLGAGTDSSVFKLAFGMDERLYITGGFTTVNGVAANRCARWNRAAWSALSTGFNATGQNLYVDRNGDIYFVGNFTTAGGTTVNHGCVWKGSQFLPLGPGFDNNSNCIMGHPDGTIWFGGVFTTAGGLDAPGGIAIWNRSTWTVPDLGFDPAAPRQTFAIAINQTTGDTYIGQYGAVGDTDNDAAAITTLTNTGTASAHPVIQLVGPGVFVWLENQTTGDRIYLDMIVLDGETVTFDLSDPAKKITSSFGVYNVQAGVIPGSDLAKFHLIPGDNRIALFAYDTDAGTTARAWWTIRHESVEGGS